MLEISNIIGKAPEKLQQILKAPPSLSKWPKTPKGQNRKRLLIYQHLMDGCYSKIIGIQYVITTDIMYLPAHINTDVVLVVTCTERLCL